MILRLVGGIMINIKLKTLVFNCLFNINKKTGRRFLTLKQLYFYISLLGNEFDKSNIRVNFDVNFDDIKTFCSDVLHVYELGCFNYVFFMLPWIDSYDLMIGPMFMEIFNIMNSDEVINKVIYMDERQVKMIEMIQRKVEEDYLFEVASTIDVYLNEMVENKREYSEYSELILKEQEKIDKYRDIKIRVKKRFKD